MNNTINRISKKLIGVAITKEEAIGIAFQEARDKGYIPIKEKIKISKIKPFDTILYKAKVFVIYVGKKKSKKIDYMKINIKK